MQRKSFSLSSKKAAVLSVITAALLIAAACVLNRFLSGKEYYYLMAVLIIAVSCLPLLVSFEKSRPSARELAVLACMSALAAASRAAFFSLPTIKPSCAIVIITAACFGAQSGFICGALSMFVSNFLFGQGPWTPFQMLAMGAVGLAAGLIFCNKKVRNNRLILASVGGMLCFVIYGLIVDISSVLMMATVFSLKQILSIYASGVPFNFSHAATTAVVLLLAGKAFIEKLDRIKIKYGMFGSNQ